MSWEKFQMMTDEELRELSVQKFKNGRYKKAALYAQRELWERRNWGTKEDPFIDDGHHDVTIEDLQYEGEIDNL